MMVVYGGLGLSDTWTYEFTSGTWTEWAQRGSLPGQRHGAGVVSYEDSMFVVAGSTVNICRGGRA